MEIVSNSYLSLLIKGRFTFLEAKKAFSETADIFEKGVTEPIAEKRMDYAKQIFEISRPLWQEEIEFEKAMEELADMLSELGKESMSGSGNGQDGDPSSVDSSKKDKRRKITIKKVSKEEMEELKKNCGSESGSIPDDGDITIYTCDEDQPDDSNTNQNSATNIPTIPKSEKDSEDAANEASNNSATSSSDNEEGNEENTSAENRDQSNPSQGEPNSKDNSSDEESDKGDESCNSNENQEDDKKDNEEENEPSLSLSKNNPYKPSLKKASATSALPSMNSNELEEESDCSIDEDEYQIDEQDLATILSELERDEQEAIQEAEAQSDYSSIPDYDISSGKMPQKSCLNYRITFNETSRAALENAYALTLNKMATGIHTTTKALKRIIEDDKEEKEYRSAGNISLKRLYSGTVTDRIFEKKISPADKSDVVVEILVDESGSMDSNNKYLAARECCIALSEIFNNLHIPVYVIGFTADAMGYDVVHSHYITWKNTKDDRLKLLNISARADNCDGASIRYATEVIKKKQAKNKLLIVISDGRPVAHNYYHGDEDTKDAIKAAKKHTSVLGVAVGNNDTEKIRYFYEKDFLHVSNVNELFAGIAKAVKKIIKTW